MNSILSNLLMILLLATLLTGCGNVNKSVVDPPAIPTATGLPAQPEESDSDIPNAYPPPAENQQEAESYPAPASDANQNAYPAPPDSPTSPTPYPEPKS